MSEVVKKKRRKNYLTSDEIRAELQVCHVRDGLTNRMVDMFCLMIDKIQAPFKYPSDDVRMDIRSFAIEQLVKKWKSCDINRPNLFSFFTQVIKNDLYAGWNSYKRGCADFSYSTIFTDDV